MGRLDQQLLRLARPEDSARQMAQVQLQARLRWPGSGIRLESVLKIAEEASVFRGHRGNEPVVIKKFWDQDSRRSFVGGTVRALGRFDRLATHPEFSVNRCISSSGRLGLVMLSWEAGTPVNKLIKKSWANRQQILRKCCAWQDWASQGQVVRAALPANAYYKEISAILAACTRHPDAALLKELGRELLNFLGRIEDQPAVRAPGHPDFAPRNLILRPDGGVAAIDIHRSGTFFGSRQAAIFLVSKDFSSKRKKRPLLYGLDRREMRLFLAHSSIPEEEFETFLVFCIGLTLLRMHSKKTRHMRRRMLKCRRIQAYLDDLRQGRRIKA